MNYLILMSLFATVTVGKSPRLKFVVHEPSRFHFNKPENYISMYHQEGSDTLYVGGQAMIYVLTFTNRGVRNLQIPAASDQTAIDTCKAKAAPLELECDNFITVIQKVNDTLVVCGTNAGSPRCWMLVNDTVLTDVQGNGQIASASDISPPYPSQKSINLPAGNKMQRGNQRGKTVICAYSIEDIDQAFSTSKLKGYSSPFIGTRPGMCVPKNATAAGGHTEIKNLGVIRYHPEIEDVIRPVGVAPLDLPTDDQITHAVADIVLAVNDEHYSVLYLGTDQGKVLKVLHSSEGVFVVSQYSLFHNEGPVLNMAIDSPKGHLYVGTAMEVQRLPLADCGRYGDTCRECILSRDPYCGWDRSRRKCIAIPPGYNVTTGALIQNLDHSNSSVCGEAAALKLRRTSPRELMVPSNTTVFLPCPVRSFHATYRWEKDNCINNYPCLFSGDFCVLGPVVDTPLKEGVFRCMATEDGFKVEVISFRLVNNGRLLAASLASTFGLSLLLAAATLWLH
ncbi:semaphorin-7A [Notolabrus celidotus]|uniref:semaphorin-7A n=1 Tax=Notolabrus celidotus TaxID=1203425 RepID=UPI0014908993|nr:semaphorin-7A [Notolabrus celidotus]